MKEQFWIVIEGFEEYGGFLEWFCCKEKARWVINKPWRASWQNGRETGTDLRVLQSRQYHLLGWFVS